MKAKPKTKAQSSAGYNRCYERMHAAALAWQEKHREIAWGELHFNPLGVPANHFVAAALDARMRAERGANAITRNLLDTLDDAAHQQATVAQAEAVIETVFGIRRALTVRPEHLPPRQTIATNDREPETYRFEGQACPDCGKVMDAATCFNGDGRGPSAGDFTVCLACAAVLVFTDDMKLRAATFEETNRAPTELMAAVKAVATVSAGQRKP